MFHVRGNICLCSKTIISKEMFAHGNVIHTEEERAEGGKERGRERGRKKRRQRERERENPNSHWHDLGESAAIICQIGRIKTHDEQRNK